MTKHANAKTWNLVAVSGRYYSDPANEPGGSLPVNTVAPSITGTAAVGSTLTGHVGTWSGSPTSYAKQWYRATDSGSAFSAIPGASADNGATTLNYVPVEDDEGYVLKFGSSAENAGGTAVEVRSSATSAVAPAGSLAALPLVDSSWFRYKGFFNLPNYGSVTNIIPETSTEFSAPIGLGPSNTLYTTGHPWGDYSFHLTIPSIGGTAAVASEAQSLVTDIGAGLSSEGRGTARSVLYNGVDRIAISHAASYDANSSATYSHTVANPNLTGKSGPFRAKWLSDTTYGYAPGPANAYFNAGKMCRIPSEWQAAFGGSVLSAQGMASINTRTPWGHALYAFDPDGFGVGTVGQVSNPLPASPLCIHPGWARGDTNMNITGLRATTYQVTDSVTGVAFLPGTGAVLVFGVHGDGWYGYGLGTSDEAKASRYPDAFMRTFNTEENEWWNYNECYGSKGEHAWPFKQFVWAYRATELAEVKAGVRLPESIRPYAVWEFSGITAAAGWGGGDYTAPGCTAFASVFDDSNGRLYVKDGANGVIKVFELAEPA